jgi:cellulose synthase/poly-beta-1,6-N-acetylglucosamine synthase-like glycosyltransferase
MFFELAIASCAATLGWVYLGYPVSLALLARGRPEPTAPEGFAPDLTLVIPAYNELDEVDAKVANTRELRYPGRLRVLWVTDGSDDGTDARLRALGQEVLHHSARRGKAAAIHRAMASVDTPLVAFTDANTCLPPDALTPLVAPFSDPRVGCVAGAKRVGGGGSGEGEGVYWRYEDRIKRLEGTLHSTIGAAGELIALRTEGFPPLRSDAILDDFELSMRCVLRGQRTVYAPDAVALEAPSATPADDFERRARIAAGGLQALSRLSGLFDPRQVGWLVPYCVINHRLLRWTLAPAALFALPFLLVASWLAGASGTVAALALTQGLLLLAVAAALRAPTGVWRPLATIAHFYLANAAIISGWARFARQTQTTTWTRVQRARL